jgi:hypothetical protein
LPVLGGRGNLCLLMLVDSGFFPPVMLLSPNGARWERDKG